MYKKIVVPVMLILFILQTSNLLFANEKTETKAEVKTEATAEKKVKADEAAESVKETRDDVVATVNGEEIFRKELDLRLGVYKRMNQEVTRAVQIDVISRLAMKVLLNQFVEGQNIVVSDGEMQGRLEQIKYFLRSNPNDSEKSLGEILETQGSNIGELEGEIRRTLALNKYLDQRVGDDEKSSYFESNIGVFNGEKVKLSHILIDTTKLKTDAELKTAKQKIEEVKKEIDNGADFAETAEKYSTCSSAKDGGDVGFYKKSGSLVEELDEVAFSMKVGEISEPVKTQFGYHIIKVTGKVEGKDVSYEDVEDMVHLYLTERKKDALLKRLYEKAEIEITL